MDEPFDQLLTRARAGDVRAAAVAGRRLLHGEGVQIAVPEAIELLRFAAEQGDGEAAERMAMVAAAGVMEPRDPARARRMLELAAERGWTPARKQLAVLNAGAPKPVRRVLAEAPRLRVFEGFASEAECDWLMARAREHLQRATIYHGSAALQVSEVRTNTECNLLLPVLDAVTCALVARVAAAADVTPSFCEVAKVLHYEPGQRFGEHADFQDTRSPSLAEDVRRHGQRIATFLIYLNDNYEGGETEFTKAGVRFKGRKGDALLFVNVDHTGAPDFATLHQGLPTTRGEKWVFSQWIRGKAINAFMTPDGVVDLDPDWQPRI